MKSMVFFSFLNISPGGGEIILVFVVILLLFGGGLGFLWFRKVPWDRV